MINVKSFWFIFFSIFFISCESIKYQKVVTPEEKFKNRKKDIEEQLRKDFLNKNILYKSNGFGQEIIIKPNSFYFLDSLYQQKYLLEQKGKSNKELEEKILLAKTIAQSDTTKWYFLENHVFTCLENGIKNIFYSEIICDSKNKIETIKIKESYEIPYNLEYYYSKWIFNESFVHFSFSIDEEELAFYQFYRNNFNTLDENKKQIFLIHTLELMKIADEINSLEKVQLIKMIVSKYLNGNLINLNNIIFDNIEENIDDTGNINHYLITLTMTKSLSNKKVILKLDPYLQVIEEKEE